MSLKLSAAASNYGVRSRPPSSGSSSSASSLLLRTPSSGSSVLDIHVCSDTDSDSATPTRASFFTQPDLNWSPLKQVHPTLKSHQRSLSLTPSPRRPPSLAMSMQLPSTHQPRYERRPSVSEALLRDIAGRDEQRRGASPGPSLDRHAPKDSQRSRIHHRRHSSCSRVPPLPKTPPHSQVLQARLDKVLHSAAAISPNSVPAAVFSSPSSPTRPSHALQRSNSTGGRSRSTRRSIGNGQSADMIVDHHQQHAAYRSPSVLSTPQAMREAPRSPLSISTPLTPSHRRKHHHSALLTPPPTPPGSEGEDEEDFSSSASSSKLVYSVRSAPAMPSPATTMSSMSSACSPPLLTPLKPGMEHHASLASSSYFDPKLASQQCAKMEGYVSFGEVAGLDANGLAISEESAENPKKWRWLRRW